MKMHIPGMIRDTGLFAGGAVHKGDSAPSNQTVTQTNIPKELMPYATRLLTKAETESQRGYQPYVDARGRPIERIAGTTNDQNAAYGAARNLQNTYAPSFNQASQTYNNSLNLAGNAYAGYNPNAIDYDRAGNYAQNVSDVYASSAGDYAGNRAQNDAAVSAYNPNAAGFGNVLTQGNEALAGYDPSRLDFGGVTNQTNAAVSGYNPSGVDWAGSVNRGDQAVSGYNPNVETWNQNAAQQYMNPYLESVVGNAQKAAQQNFAESQATRNARAAKTGSFGGSRAAIADEVARREYDSQFQSLTSDLLNKGYTNAQATFIADRDAKDRAAQAAATFGMQNARLNLDNASARDAASRAGANLGLQGAELNLKNLTTQDATQQYLAKLGMENANLGLSTANSLDAANQARTKFGLQGSAQNLQNLSAENAMNEYAAKLGMTTAELFGKGDANADAASRFAAQLGLDTASLGLKGGELQQGLGKDAYSLASQQARMLNEFGTNQQQEQQRRYDMQYQDFLNQHNYNKQQLQFMSNILRGLPDASSGTKTEYSTVGSNYGQGLGAIGAIAAANNTLK